ncbi:MAG: MiaB/RimO family radical SAM methylthiotransferase [Eubacteriaceae bacterium]|nr:MiaB/RimO family radical SAM methylthiotransferase [Eubacteriaceae bacterium]
MIAKIVTLGCKTNQSDSEAIAASLSKAGFTVQPDGEPSAIIINTCAVTNESERKCRQAIRKARADHKDAVIIATGCYAQLKGDSLKSFGADYAVGIKSQHLIAQLLSSILGQAASGQREQKTGHKVRKILKVQDGCDNACSYCSIYIARGNPISVSADEAVAQALRIKSEGYREIVLTGINLAKHDSGIGSLARQVAQASGIERLRIGSLDPLAINEETLGELSKASAFCEHFHISLQSGSDRILKLMNRDYGLRSIIGAVALAKSYFPTAAFTADVIVGFPSESDEDFALTKEAIAQTGLVHTHIFPFSPKTGTPAALMQGQLANAEKRKRAAELSEFANRVAARELEKHIGSSAEILPERESAPGVYEGYTRNYLRALVPSGSDIIGKIVKAKIYGNNESMLNAELIEIIG